MAEISNFQSGLDVAYLASCALAGRVPEQTRVERMDLEALYRQATRHSMNGIVAIALKSCGITGDPWDKALKAACQKIVMFQLEREQILAFMEEKGIWYMPMKGVILQDFYPQLGMRQMADNDILFDIAHRRELRDYMVERGFKVKVYGRKSHDVYLKPPVFNFEMHVDLFVESSGNNFYEYYKNVKEERLQKDEGNRWGYHMSDEDFYIYCTAHSFKHYDHGGVGLRSLMDIYVYMQRLRDRLDWTYIGRELDKLGMLDFEGRARVLAVKLFGMQEAELSEEELQLLGYHIGSGTYGTEQNAMTNKLEKISEESDGKITGFGAKLRYGLERLFPGMLYFKIAYPFLYRHRILIPFFYLWRLIRYPVFGFKRMLREIRNLIKN